MSENLRHNATPNALTISVVSSGEAHRAATPRENRKKLALNFLCWSHLK